MVKCFVLEVNDPEELPELINFELLERMKNEEVSFNVSDIQCFRSLPVTIEVEED